MGKRRRAPSALSCAPLPWPLQGLHGGRRWGLRSESRRRARRVHARKTGAAFYLLCISLAPGVRAGLNRPAHASTGSRQGAALVPARRGAGRAALAGPLRGTGPEPAGRCVRGGARAPVSETLARSSRRCHRGRLGLCASLSSLRRAPTHFHLTGVLMCLSCRGLASATTACSMLQEQSGVSMWASPCK